MNERECQWCHKVFKTLKSNTRYCSVECKDAAAEARKKEREMNGDNSDKRWKLCGICGEKFYDTTNNASTLYCSTECKKEAQRIHAIARQRQEYERDRKMHKCATCGKMFATSLYGRRKYCSEKCYITGNRQRALDASKERKKQHRKNKKKMLTIGEVNALARAEHMSYGEYVLKHHL